MIEVVSRDDFGGYLRQARERAGLSLAEVALITKIKEATLATIEEGRTDGLPAQVFVVGFISAMARSVGADPDEALGCYHRSIEARERTAQIEREALVMREIAESDPARRRFGVAVVVFFVLLAATLTLSLLLRRDGPGAGDLSALDLYRSFTS